MTDVKATIGKAIASGVNSKAVYTPHIVQYPKPPADISGAWMGLVSLAMSLVYAYKNKPDNKLLKESDTAQGAWNNELIKLLSFVGHSATQEYTYTYTTAELQDDGSLVDKTYTITIPATGAVDGLRSTPQAIYKVAEDWEPLYRDDLRAVWEAKSLSGFVPDYASVLTRAEADRAKALAAAEKNICMRVGEYNKPLNSHVFVGVQHASVKAALVGVETARGNLYSTTTKINTAIRTKAAFDADKLVSSYRSLSLNYRKAYLVNLMNVMESYSWLATTKLNAAKAKGSEEAADAVTWVEAIIGLLSLID